MTLRREKKWFGRGFGEFAERLQSAFWVGAAGVFGAFLGVVMVGYALWRLLST